jgi:hypothetical protein
MIVGFRERIPHYNYEVPEAVGCFISLDDILGLLKRASERMMNELFQEVHPLHKISESCGLGLHTYKTDQAQIRDSTH